jgi:hypothetical protein
MEGIMKHREWILVLALMSASANAAESWGNCNGCSEPQAQRAALLVAPRIIFGSHDVYVADFERGIVRKFTVTWEFDAEFREWESTVWPSATEPYIAHEFAQVVTAMKADITSLEAGKPVPVEIVGSAYDVVHSSVNQQRVANYIIENMNIWETIGAPVFVPLSVFRKIVDLNLTISVTFADGSTAKFALTGLDGSLGELTYVFELLDDSARDADGNVIPDSAADAAPFDGTFTSEGRAQQIINFIETRYTPHIGFAIRCSSKQYRDHIVVTCRRN